MTRHIPGATLALLLFLLMPVSAHAVLYPPGQTLEPSCLPTQSDCGVLISEVSFASTTANGIISTTTQSFAGDKTLEGALSVTGNIDIASTSAYRIDGRNMLRFTKPGIGTSVNYFFGESGNSTLTGSSNISVGTGLRNLTTGIQNIGIGMEALKRVENGALNVAVGSQALASTTVGLGHTAVGTGALQNMIGGQSNTAVGLLALSKLISGNQNSAFGEGALLVATSSEKNVALGSRSLTSNLTGNNNIAVGYAAGGNITTGNNNVIIGHNINAPSAVGDGQLNIGNLIFGTGLTTTGTTLSLGNVGIGTTTPVSRLSVAGDIYGSGQLAVASISTAGTSTATCFSVNGVSCIPTTHVTGTSGHIITFDALGAQQVTPHLFINTATGNIGIGTTLPSSKLSVAGSIDISADLLPLNKPTATTTGGNIVSTVDATGNVQGTMSMTVGVNGLPVVSYFDSTVSRLKILACGNSTCTSGNTISTIDNTTASRSSSIAIGSDGLPVVSYTGSAPLRLFVLKCGNSICSSGNSTTLIESGVLVGNITSIAVGIDGLPVVAYHEDDNNDLRILKCGNTACTSGNSTTTVDAVDDVGEWVSLKIAPDNVPVVAYYDLTNTALKILKCGNATCTSGNSVTTADATDNAGISPSLEIGLDGLPVVAYQVNTGVSNYVLKILKCGNATCTSGNSITTADSASNTGYSPSLRLGSDEKLLVIYGSNSNAEIMALKCGNETCTSTTSLAVISTGIAGSVSVAVGTDGLPAIAYNTVSVTGNLVFTRCGNLSCNGGSIQYTNGSNIGSTQSYFKNIYGVQYWGKRFTIANFDLAESYEEALGEGLETGEVAALNSDAKLVRAGSPAARRVIGVISAAPGLLLADWDESGSHKPLALAGRVPVRVHLEEGETLFVGDSLTYSREYPGFAQKADIGSETIGYALGALTESGTVEMFIKLGDHSFTEMLRGFDDGVSNTTAATVSSVAPSFFGALFTRLIGWFASAGNGIGDFFAERIFSKKIFSDEVCLTDSGGDYICLTADDIRDIGTKKAPSTMTTTSVPASQTQSGSQGGTTSATSTIVISINGGNPAEIHVGATYSDLGAVAESDDQALVNLGVRTYQLVDGTLTEVQNATIDTTVPGTYEIIYRVIDGDGKILAVAVRTVTVAATPVPEAAEGEELLTDETLD